MRKSPDEIVKAAALEHASQCGHYVEFHLGEGFLCRECDDDFQDFPWDNPSPDAIFDGSSMS